MVNEFFISKRIEISSELSGGGDGLKKVGFSHIMGYSKIIEELNKMHFERVYYIMNKLIKMGDLNKEFAEYIIYSEILDKDKFYQMDDMFNITENNLKNIDVNDLFNKLKSGGFGDKKLLIKFGIGFGAVLIFLII